jgi:DNA-directed RNA polymerase specialized sigma24 family protein
MTRLGVAGKPRVAKRGEAMSATDRSREALDAMARKACGGDREAESALFADLRVRFLQIAKRRVREEQCEDLVQDALAVVHAKYASRPPGRGVLIWCLAVLRNVIGNHYQAEKRRRGLIAEAGDEGRQAGGGGAESAALPGEDDLELRGRLDAAIESLADRYPRCAEIFRLILEGLGGDAGPSEINAALLAHLRGSDPELSRGSFYVMLHRCRGRLRELLDPGEEESSHA